MYLISRVIDHIDDVLVLTESLNKTICYYRSDLKLCIVIEPVVLLDGDYADEVVFEHCEEIADVTEQTRICPFRHECVSCQSKDQEEYLVVGGVDVGLVEVGGLQCLAQRIKEG